MVDASLVEAQAWFNGEIPMKIALATSVRVVTSNGSKVKAVGGGFDKVKAVGGGT